jgi:phosphoglycerate kinase
MSKANACFMRVDYNVPLEEKDGKMVITDATRIVETLPTLKLLIEKGGKLILTAHLGRPKGKREATMSLRPVAEKLAELLHKPVTLWKIASATRWPRPWRP